MSHHRYSVFNPTSHILFSCQMAIIEEGTTMNEGIKLTSYGYCMMFVMLQAEP